MPDESSAPRKRSSIPRAVRVAVWMRDGQRCGLCGGPVEFAELEIDHLIPAMRGGTNAPDNLRASHRWCNRHKGRADARYYGYAPGHPSPYLHPPLLTAAEQFAACLAPVDSEGHQLWLGRVSAAGLPVFRGVSARRLVWRQIYPAPIPSTAWLKNVCGAPRCVRLTHQQLRDHYGALPLLWPGLAAVSALR